MFEALFKKKLILTTDEYTEEPAIIRMYNKAISSKNFHIKGFVSMLISSTIGFFLSYRMEDFEGFNFLYIPEYYANGLALVFLLLSFFGVLYLTKNILLAGVGLFFGAKALDWFMRTIETSNWYQELNTKTFIDGVSGLGIAATYYGMFFFQFSIHFFFLFHSLKKIKTLYSEAEKEYAEYTESGRYSREQYGNANQHYQYAYSQYEHFKQENERNQQQYSQGTNYHGSGKNHNDINFFSGCESVEDVERRYKKLAQLYHPDTGMGDEETMKIINSQKEAVLNKFQ